MRNLESELPESKGDPTKRERRKRGARSREWNECFWRVFGNSQVKAKGPADGFGDGGSRVRVCFMVDLDLCDLNEPELWKMEQMKL